LKSRIRIRHDKFRIQNTALKTSTKQFLDTVYICTIATPYSHYRQYFKVDASVIGNHAAEQIVTGTGEKKTQQKSIEIYFTVVCSLTLGYLINEKINPALVKIYINLIFYRTG
jgi:hypothetical protein